MSKAPSPHLSYAELECHDAKQTPYPEEWRLTRLVELAELFEAFRMWCGSVPMLVLSAYRTPAWNRLIGGARRSQHVEGRALDLWRPGWSVQRLHDEARRFAVDDPVTYLLGGLGLYPMFVHLDTRKTDRLIVWNGGRLEAEVSHA